MRLQQLMLVIGVLIPCEAFAGFISFTDRTDFLNAASAAGLSLTNEDFSTNPGDPFTIDDGNGSGVEFDITNGTYIGVFDAIVGGNGSDLPVVLESTSVTGSVVGIGFNIAYQSNSNLVLQRMTLNDGDATIFSPIGESVGFLGLLSTDGMMISSVDEIRLNSSLNNVPRLTNLDIVTGSANPVPEPSSLALLGMGSLSLFGCAWRRRKRETAA